MGASQALPSALWPFQQPGSSLHACGGKVTSSDEGQLGVDRSKRVSAYPEVGWVGLSHCIIPQKSTRKQPRMPRGWKLAPQRVIESEIPDCTRKNPAAWDYNVKNLGPQNPGGPACQTLPLDISSHATGLKSWGQLELQLLISVSLGGKKVTRSNKLG